MTFKPQGYNSVSPYVVVSGAERLIDFLGRVFDARVMRRYDNPDGTIMHAEVMIDDSPSCWEIRHPPTLRTHS